MISRIPTNSQQPEAAGADIRPGNTRDILVFSPYYPPHIGGLENYVQELAMQAAARGHRLTILTSRLPRSAPRDEHPHHNIHVIRQSAFELVTNYPVLLPWHPVLKNKYDLIISNTRFFLTSLCALIYSKRTHTPWMHIEHGSSFVNVTSSLTTWLAKIYDLTLGRFVLTHSSINIAISQAVKRFIEKFDQRSTPVIYRGLNTAILTSTQAQLPTEIDAANRVVMVTVGRLFKWKGLTHSIKAVLGLPPEFRNRIMYLIVGDGEDYVALAKQVQPPVYLIGARSYQNTIGILKAADIYIHASLPGGGMSTTLLEAMYCRCAVIATPHEGAAEMIDDGINGSVVPAADPIALRDALIPLITDQRQQQRYGEAAQRTIQAKIGWPASLQQLEDVWTKLLH